MKSGLDEVMRITYVDEDNKIKTILLYDWSDYQYDEFFFEVFRGDAINGYVPYLLIPTIHIIKVEFLTREEIGHGI